MPSEKPLEDPELLRKYTWQNIIYSHEAKQSGIKITDEDVRNELANILKQQGLISPTPEQYKIWLTRSLHISPREFEEGLREFMRIQKLLRVKIASFAPAGIDKLTDPKAKEEAAAKQKTRAARAVYFWQMRLRRWSVPFTSTRAMTPRARLSPSISSLKLTKL